MIDHLANAAKFAERLLDITLKTEMTMPERVQIIVAAAASQRPPDVWKMAGILASERLCNIILQALGAPQFNPSELGTVLAALRFWQDRRTENGDPDIWAIATEAGEPLTNPEIDALCERINR